MSRAEVLATGMQGERAAVALIDCGCIMARGVASEIYDALTITGFAERDDRGFYRPSEKLWIHARDVWGIERSRTIAEQRKAA